MLCNMSCLLCVMLCGMVRVLLCVCYVACLLRVILCVMSCVMLRVIGYRFRFVSLLFLQDYSRQKKQQQLTYQVQLNRKTFDLNCHEAILWRRSLAWKCLGKYYDFSWCYMHPLINRTLPHGWAVVSICAVAPVSWRGYCVYRGLFSQLEEHGFDPRTTFGSEPNTLITAPRLS